MTIVKGDPTYLEDKDHYFMNIAKEIAKGSNHPIAPGGAVITRSRDIIGDGRSVLASCKVEVDCVTYALATAARHGTALDGSVIYTTRYPFSASVFQMHIVGIYKVVVLSHEWEAYYRDEYRRSARLARELGIAIEPMFEDSDELFGTNTMAPRFDNQEDQFNNKDLYTLNPVVDDLAEDLKGL